MQDLKCLYRSSSIMINDYGWICIIIIIIVSKSAFPRLNASSGFQNIIKTALLHSEFNLVHCFFYAGHPFWSNLQLTSLWRKHLLTRNWKIIGFMFEIVLIPMKAINYLLGLWVTVPWWGLQGTRHTERRHTWWEISRLVPEHQRLKYNTMIQMYNSKQKKHCQFATYKWGEGFM
jgi:hypothetical protein